MNKTSTINENLALMAFNVLHSNRLPNFFAVNSSDIQPLPHQVRAVYSHLLPRSPLHFLLADDPGAGKTIMTALFLKELDIRDSLHNCLIIAPASLTDQWQEELASKFHLFFSHINDKSHSGLLIAKLDTLARNSDLQLRLAQHSWDAIVFDEAHKLSVQVSGNEIHYTKRFRLAQRLSRVASNFLLLTATPHNGKPEEFRHFLSLLNAEHFTNSDSYMRRLQKEELVKFDCSPLFPQRQARTVSYSLSGPEFQLYEDVTEYVRNQFNSADRLDDRRRGSAVGFALTLLQRRLASSPEAIFQSLTNRANRLQNKSFDTPPDYDEITDTESPADYVSASLNNAELQREIRTLKDLAQQAAHVRFHELDIKWQKLSELLQHDLKGEKLIVFTEHRATLNYLADKIRTLLGRYDSLVTIHGGMSLKERHHAEAAFRDYARILVATDAAGEGINLQCAHIMINYDLPWNPNRLEQRFGRIHRIGQQHDCLLFNLIAGNTREGQVFSRLFAKLQAERQALDGRVFDVLGDISVDGKSLSDIILQAIRDQTTPDIEHHTLLNATPFHCPISREEASSLLHEIMAAKSQLIPQDDIKAFVCEALPLLNVNILRREGHNLEITYVPQSLLNLDSRILRSYRRVCFSPTGCGELLTQAHPLVRAAAQAIIAKLSGQDSDSPAGRKFIEIAAMNAVFAHELSLGNSPRDVSSLNLGFDIESISPDGSLRFIEVKGRAADSTTVTLTSGEIRFALSHPDNFILAIVFVNGTQTHLNYCTHCFRNPPDDAEVSRTYRISGLGAIISSSQNTVGDSPCPPRS